MAAVTLSSGCTSHSISTDRHRDPSFSSYLRSSEKAFIRKLADSSMNPNPHDHLHLGRKKKVEDREIGVFGAEKYFNAAVGGEDDGPRVAGGGDGAICYQFAIDKTAVKPKNQPGTPSLRSESSWNSQIALLQQNVSRLIPPRRKTTKKRHGNGKSLLASLGCNCSCNGENSVGTYDEYGAVETNSTISRAAVKVAKEPTTQNGPPDTVDSSRNNKSRMINPSVVEEIHCKKIQESAGLGLIREDCFSFPIRNSTAGNPEVKVYVQENEKDDEEQRKSLEVFGSPIMDKKSKSFERRPAVSLWESKSRTEELEIPASSDRICDDDDDNESDVSSDLFEIESFTHNGGNHPFLPDGMSRSSCVTPSEASIEWSVVTASAVEISATSDSEDLTSAAAAVTGAKERKMGLNGGGSAGEGKEMEKRRAGILLSCKSYRAVRVTGDAHRTTGKLVLDPGRRHRSSRGFDSRKGNLS